MTNQSDDDKGFLELVDYYESRHGTMSPKEFIKAMIYWSTGEQPGEIIALIDDDRREQEKEWFRKERIARKLKQSKEKGKGAAETVIEKPETKARKPPESKSAPLQRPDSLPHDFKIEPEISPMTPGERYVV